MFVPWKGILNLSRTLSIKLLPEFGMRGRPTASPGGLYFKAKPHWLSDVYSCLVRHLCLTAQTLVSVTSETCVCRLGHLRLSRQRLSSA